MVTPISLCRKFQLAVGISSETGLRYLKLAKAFPEPITALPEAVYSLTDLLRSIGALPELKGHGEQQQHDFNAFASITRSAGKLKDVFSKALRLSRSSHGTAIANAQLRDQLEPLVKIYSELED